ncbi:hypothetical protein XAPC_1731 [Xanthomonas citri pv. punicae str. LMG 859]|nr:hypothetical protein XAPC_1731 [Xanthomonas citri pv. punicae str. LMG 859]
MESSGGTRGYCSATAGPGQQARANAVQQRRRWAGVAGVFFRDGGELRPRRRAG